MKISVCVGSSCHLRGSYDVINMMKEAIEVNKLEEKVELAASFCLGQCTDGVSVKIGEDTVVGVNKENFDEVFKKYVLDVL